MTTVSDASGLRAPASVRVTHHAVERLRTRSPFHRSLSVDALSHTMRAEVSCAIKEGRFSCTKPRWATWEIRSKHTGRMRNRRYAWNREQTHLYSLLPLPKREHPAGGWLVITVMTGPESRRQADARLSHAEDVLAGTNPPFGDAAA